MSTNAWLSNLTFDLKPFIIIIIFLTNWVTPTMTVQYYWTTMVRTTNVQKMFWKTIMT